MVARGCTIGLERGRTTEHEKASGDGTSIPCIYQCRRPLENRLVVPLRCDEKSLFIMSQDTGWRGGGDISCGPPSVRGDATRACAAGNGRVRSPGDNAVPSQPEGSNHRQRAWPLRGTMSESPVEGSSHQGRRNGLERRLYGDEAAASL